MASEVVSTTTTLAGLMERVQAQAISLMLTQGARLFEACNTKNANNALTVQWPAPIVPSGVSISAQTEANAVTSTAMSMAAKTATIAAYPYQTLVSKLALEGGQFTEMELAGQIVTFVAQAIDKTVCGQIDDFTNTIAIVSGTMTPAVFLRGRKALYNTGFIGTPIAIISETHWSALAAGLSATFVPITNENVISNGYRGTVYGVQVFVVPDTYLTAGADEVTVSRKAGFFFKEVGIGLGYHDPLIRVKVTPYDTLNDYFGGFAMVGVTEISAGGGVELDV